MKPVARKRIGELLLDQGAIDDHQLQSALQYQRDHGGRLGAALVAKGALTEEQLVKVLGETLNIPVVDIPDRIDPAALKLIKTQFAEDHEVFPLHLDDARTTGRRTLALAVADPLDIPTLEEVEFVTGCRVQPVLATPSQIRVAILRHYRKQNIDQRRQGGSMTVVRPGGVEEEIDTTRSASRPPSAAHAIARAPSRPPPKAAAKPQPKFGDEEEVMPLLDEVTSRTEVAELIRDRERRRKRSTPDDNLKFLTGETEQERTENLERKFWALMRILASRGTHHERRVPRRVRQVASAGDHQKARLGVGLHRVPHAFAPQPGALHPAVGHRVRPEGRRVVDHQRPHFESFERSPHLAEILGVQARLQAVVAAVDLGQRGFRSRRRESPPPPGQRPPRAGP